jgi:hypothetical protein
LSTLLPATILHLLELRGIVDSLNIDQQLIVANGKQSWIDFDLMEYVCRYDQVELLDVAVKLIKKKWIAAKYMRLAITRGSVEVVKALSSRYSNLRCDKNIYIKIYDYLQTLGDRLVYNHNKISTMSDILYDKGLITLKYYHRIAKYIKNLDIDTPPDLLNWTDHVLIDVK